MKAAKIIAISIISIVLLIGIALFFIGYFKPKPGGILVSTSPASSVYINGEMVGKTPYEGTYKAGETVIKLVPDSSADKTYLPFETKVSLVSGVKTVIRREFSENEDMSSGDIISFEKEGGSETSLVVISTPDNSQISVDGTPKGFAPYKLLNVIPGEHQISIKSVGFRDRVLTVKAVSGYRLSIITDLAKDETQEKVAAAETEIKTYIEILTTPTGFLRVRTEPGSGGKEVQQVNPGEKFLLLEEDEASGWYKVQLEAPVPGLPNGREGWVSNEYSKKVEEEVTLPDSPPETF
ncbi:MAG: PEGA domain-containing protein [Microgenomates group bacterium]